MCQFVDDIATVTELIRQRNDMKVIEEKDYITHSKPSGYRSHHMIIEYPVETIQGRKIVIAEIQIRTLAMNFWASIEHSLNYKYKGEFPEEIKESITKCCRGSVPFRRRNVVKFVVKFKKHKHTLANIKKHQSSIQIIQKRSVTNQ